MEEIKLQRKNIKKVMYALAIICSIYFSYLIYHAYSVGGKISLILALILSTISIYLVDIVDKTVKWGKISKKVLCMLGVVSILLASIILLSDFDFFTKKFVKSNVTITVLKEKNNNSRGNEVYIRGIVQGNTLQNLKKVKRSQGWKYKGGKIGTTGEAVDELTIPLKKSNRSKIVLQTSESSGKVKITDGKYEEIIDLYSYKTEMKDYVIKGNCHIDLLFGIRLLCSYGMILLVVFILILVSYDLFKKNKSIILPIFLLILALRCFYYSNLQAYSTFDDTQTYIEYSFRDFIHLKFPARTPVYPLIILICKALFGTKYLNFVVLFQICVSFIAVIYFYKILKLIIKNKIVIAVVTFIYGVTPAICGYDNCILTESLALSGYVFFIYNMIKYIKENKLRNGLLAVGISLVFTFLRPTCLILVAILLVFWVARFLFDRKSIKTDFYCFIGSIFSIGVILIYSLIFYQTHQIFSISDPTIRQNLFICISQGFYKASNDKNFIQDIESKTKEVEETTNLTGNLKVWEVEEFIQEKYGNKRVQELTVYCKKQMKEEYHHYLLLLLKSTYASFYSSYSKLIMNYDNFLLDIQLFVTKFVNFSYVYLMILTELGITLYKCIKEKQVPWIHVGLFAFTFTIMASSFIGTNSEYMRTSIGVVPFFYISIAIFLNYICRTGQNKIQKA